MVMGNPNVPLTFADWDSHAVNTHIFEDARRRFPIYDGAVTALVEVLHARGLTEPAGGSGMERGLKVVHLASTMAFGPFPVTTVSANPRLRFG